MTDTGDSSSVLRMASWGKQTGSNLNLELKSSTLCGSQGKALQQRRLDTAAARRAQCSETPEVSRFLARMFVVFLAKTDGATWPSMVEAATTLLRDGSPSQQGAVSSGGWSRIFQSVGKTLLLLRIRSEGNWGQMSHVQVV